MNFIKTTLPFDDREIPVFRALDHFSNRLYGSPQYNICPQWLIQSAGYRSLCKELDEQGAILHIILGQCGIDAKTDYESGINRWCVITKDWKRWEVNKNIFFVPHRWRCSFEDAANDLSLIQFMSRSGLRRRKIKSASPVIEFCAED